MAFVFENQGTNTYLVYTVSSEDVVDTMSLGMLTNNKIDGLATTIFMQLDMTKYIKYNVSAKVSAKQLFTGPVNKKRLLGVFSGIVNAMISAEDYMIDTNSILLDLDYIFADVSTCETVLICLPITNQVTENRDLGTFFKNIVFSTQFDQTENCDYVAKIINYLNSTPVFSLVEFDKLLKEISQNSVAVQHVPTQKAVVQPQAQPTTPTKQETPKQPVQNVQPVQQVQPVQKVVSPQGNVVNNQVRQEPINKPVQQPVKPPVNVAQPVQKTDEKPMSMFYLLQHYNKENAATYKAQKEAKKNKGAAPKQTTAPFNTPVRQSFAVPGAPTGQGANNVGYAIPGQASKLGNTGFVIPGQPSQPPVTPVQPVQSVAQKPVQEVQPKKVETVTSVPIQTMPAQEVPQGKPMNFGETTVLNGGMIGETTVLDAAMVKPEVKVQPYLIRAKNNERIELNKPVFRIGKEKSYVDYFISDNTAISRSHANIVNRDGEYFVVDTNSTNHTYVNGMMIQSNVETKLTEGTKIRLANEDFTFYTK